MDDDSIDIGFGAKNKHRARLEAQLKCTYAHGMKDDGLAIPLSLKNYDDTRAAPLCVVYIAAWRARYGKRNQGDGEAPP